MKFQHAFFPLPLVWSSPFVRWQGSLADVSSLDLAAAVTGDALTERRVDRAAIDRIVLGMTIPQANSFYAAPWLASRLGLPGVSGPLEIIRAPLVSEKGTLLAESANQVLFKVRPEANKIEVKKAVESLFKVKVVKVRMARYLGKIRRVGRSMGRRPGWKKAYVTLKEGFRLDII
jgi:ribosomal protein L23